MASKMLRRATVLWIVGLITVIPLATYHLFFRAPREQYAILITLILFWIFGYWSIVGPLLALARIRSVFRAIQQVQSRDDLVRTLQSAEARDVAIEHIAADNHIPRFLATHVYEMLVRQLSARTDRGSKDEPRRMGDRVSTDSPDDRVEG